MKRKLLAIAAAVLLLSGCSSISSGYVTKKAHEPAYTYSQMICSGYSSKGYCTIWVPIIHNVPDHWRLDLKNGDKTGWVYVSPQTFNDIKVGDVYNDKEKN